MNIWLRASPMSSPYRRTAFRVARVPREVVRHRTLVQLLGQTRQLLSTDAKAHRIDGEAVRSAEINAAEQILLDPVQRVLEELLEHKTERLSLEIIRKLAREATQAMELQEDQFSGPANWKVLELLAPDLVSAFLTAVPGPSPSFGALELGTAPPFGRQMEE